MNLTLEQAILDFVDIIKGKEDFVYEIWPESESCVYFYENAPSCIVGHLLDKYDVQISSEHELNVFEIGNPKFLEYLSDKGFDIDQRALDLLKVIQDFQDEGIAWQEAFHRALRQVATFEWTLVQSGNVDLLSLDSKSVNDQIVPSDAVTAHAEAMAWLTESV